ncbi:hypothetical protein [Nocardioides immobilis]
MGSRRIVGFGIGEHHDADLATAALRMAVAVRGGKDNIGAVIMHTDQGSEGEINRSSQHLDHGGVRWDDRGSRCRKRRLGRDGSGPRTGQCERRCAHRAGPSRRGLCSETSGA